MTGSQEMANHRKSITLNLSFMGAQVNQNSRLLEGG